MRAWLTVAVLLLAGCAGREAEGEEHQEPTVADLEVVPPPTVSVLRFNETFQRELTQAQAPVFGPLAVSRNCIALPAIRILSGNATANWTPQDAFDAELEIVFGGDGTHHARGPPPLVLPLDNLTLQPRDGQYKVWVQVPEEIGPAAVAARAVNIHLDFEYDGPEQLEVQHNWSCAGR